ncbi:HTH-type transcriptional regulator dicA [Streptococcus pneumoniae]|nr:HTH-type transcriptional regulator dicA [Streptococcus pneumoniae]
MIDVSVSLRLFRERNNKTEDDLANYLGIQKKAYKRYESGDREPSIDKLYKLAKYYNCGIDDFINVDEKFTVKREEVLSTKDLDNLGCHHQFSHGLVSMLTKGKSHEEMIRFIKDDKTKYVLKSEVKQYLLNLADRIDKN